MSASAKQNKKKRRLEESDSSALNSIEPPAKRRKTEPVNNEQDEEEDPNEDLLIGPMSPRMLYRLKICAEVSNDIARDSAPNWNYRVPEYDFEAYLSEYLPARFRKNMYKSFWMGYCQCFEAISEILKRKQVPSIYAIDQELKGNRIYDSRYTQYYLNNGGLIEYALDAIIKRSKEESCPSPFGDESFFEIPEFEEEHDALPEMKEYDFDYDQVWECLCGESDCMVFELGEGGPYQSEDEEDEEEEEDDDLSTWYQKQCHRVFADLIQRSQR